MFNIDPSPILFGDKQYAVHCETEEQAEAFFDYLRINFPERIKGWSSDGCMWDTYKQNTTYSPCLNGKGAYNRLTYYFKDWFYENDYEVVEFLDLCVQEIPDINEEDVSCLLGLTSE